MKERKRGKKSAEASLIGFEKKKSEDVTEDDIEWTTPPRDLTSEIFSLQKSKQHPPFAYVYLNHRCDNVNVFKCILTFVNQLLFKSNQIF